MTSFLRRRKKEKEKEENPREEQIVGWGRGHQQQRGVVANDPNNHTPAWVLNAAAFQETNKQIRVEMEKLRRILKKSEDAGISPSSTTSAAAPSTGEEKVPLKRKHRFNKKRWSASGGIRSLRDKWSSKKKDKDKDKDDTVISVTLVAEFQRTSQSLLGLFETQRSWLKREGEKTTNMRENNKIEMLEPPAPPSKKLKRSVSIDFIQPTPPPMSVKLKSSKSIAMPTKPPPKKETSKCTGTTVRKNRRASPTPISPSGSNVSSRRSSKTLIETLPSTSRSVVSSKSRLDVADVEDVDEMSNDVTTDKVSKKISPSNSKYEESDEEPTSTSSSSEEDVAPIHRDKLPVIAQPAISLTLWALVRSMGNLPIQLYEPITTLQRLAEDLEYSHLLDSAAQEKDAVNRICHVASFAVSGYAGTLRRSGRKPFQPLLGETFHLDRWDERGWRVHSEQVQHKPFPVSASQAEGKEGWVWRQELAMELRTNIKAGCVELVPEGETKITLRKTSESYTFNKVRSAVHNIQSPNRRCVSHHGDMIVTSSGGLKASLRFHKGEGNYNVKGKVSNAQGAVVGTLEGKWTEGMSRVLACPSSKSQTPSATTISLFHVNALPVDENLYYGFSQLARQLNEIPPADLDSLPPTDSRLRPDVRALEEGNVKKAQQKKKDLEEAQRSRRATEKEPFKPMWFTSTKEDKGKRWVSKGEYWKGRDETFKNRQFPLNLFSSF